MVHCCNVLMPRALQGIPCCLGSNAFSSSPTGAMVYNKVKNRVILFLLVSVAND